MRPEQVERQINKKKIKRETAADMQIERMTAMQHTIF